MRQYKLLSQFVLQVHIITDVLEKFDPELEQPKHIKRILTSLINQKEYNIQSQFNVYSERWEIENSYGEIKHDMLENKILLRSQSTERGQEI